MPDEIDRVLALPRIETDGAEAATAWTRYYGGKVPLNAAQGQFLAAAHLTAKMGDGKYGPRGAAGLLGCGWGKTLCGLLAPSVYKARNPLLILPAGLKPQQAHQVEHWRQAGYPVKEIPMLSYEALSRPDRLRVLDDNPPDLLIFDEAHLLANPKSARWKRLARFIFRTRCRVVLLSGTLSWMGLGQMGHLLHACLRDLSPLPAGVLLRHVANCADVGTNPTADDHAVTARLVGGGGWFTRPKTDRVSVRHALFDRIRTAPGVAFASGVAADVSMVIQADKIAPCKAAQVALHDLESRWVLPDGTPLVDSIETFRHARTLARGFYLRWIPGTVNQQWLEARRLWAREVTRLLEYSARPDLESPGLIDAAAKAGRLDTRAMRVWAQWEPYRTMPPPPSEAVWLPGGEQWCRDLVTKYRSDTEPSVLWYSSPVLGALIEGMGCPVHGAASAAPVPQAQHPIVGASWRVHGKGWNGQAFHRQVFLEGPTSAGDWEQVLSRLHRAGQTADVHTILPIIGPEGNLIHAALAGARYSQQVLGAPQRLLLADWIGTYPITKG